MNTFAARLKHYREGAGLTQSQLASLAQTSQSAIGNWEAGTRTPRAEALYSIAQVLSVAPQELLGKSINPMTNDRAELQLLAVFRSLSPKQQALGLTLLKAVRANDA